MSVSSNSVRILAGFTPRLATNVQIGSGDWIAIEFSEPGGNSFVPRTGTTLSPSDITVYDDGNEVVVTQLTEYAVTLESAPGGTVTATYMYSSVNATMLSEAIATATAEVYGKLIAMYTVASLQTSTLVDKLITYIAAATLSDAAYNDMGANTPSAQFPPDRLRRVAYNLLEEICNGALTLIDANLVEIPVVADIDTWMEESSYANRERLFEYDPFDATAGILDRSTESAWNWDSDFVSEIDPDDIESI